MPAPTVYEGANGRYEGTLFNGVKFWVAQRVPARSRVVDNIKAGCPHSPHITLHHLTQSIADLMTSRQDNGGKTVLLEKHADVLIADHARKDTPPGSVSWRYVLESVDKGELLNIDDYRIQHANPSRPAGSTLPTTRGPKVPYTKEDEQILVTWVRLQIRAGGSTQGNELYKGIAQLVSHALRRLSASVVAR